MAAILRDKFKQHGGTRRKIRAGFIFALNTVSVTLLQTAL